MTPRPLLSSAARSTSASCDAAAELEEPFPGIAVPFVLLDGVLHGLFGQAVLELEGGHGQPIDEEGQVQGELRLVAAVAELPGDAEPVLRVTFDGGRVVR